MYSNAYTDMFKNTGDLFRNDMFKNGADLFKGGFDMNQLIANQRRSAQALSEASQVLVEGAQESFRAGTETLRCNVETALKSSKDVMSSGTPEVGLAKQAEVARSIYENTLTNLREVTEMATKCGFEAFEVLNRCASENMDMASKPVRNKKK